MLELRINHSILVQLLITYHISSPPHFCDQAPHFQFFPCCVQCALTIVLNINVILSIHVLLPFLAQALSDIYHFVLKLSLSLSLSVLNLFFAHTRGAAMALIKMSIKVFCLSRVVVLVLIDRLTYTHETLGSWIDA